MCFQGYNEQQIFIWQQTWIVLWRNAFSLSERIWRQSLSINKLVHIINTFRNQTNLCYKWDLKFVGKYYATDSSISQEGNQSNGVSIPMVPLKYDILQVPFILSSIRQTIIGIMLWISNCSQAKLWKVIANPRPNLNDDLVKPPMKFGHGQISTFYKQKWM